MPPNKTDRILSEPISLKSNDFLPADVNFSTRAIHSGYEPSQSSCMSVIPPISLSTTYEQLGPAQPKLYEYGRSNNPSRDVLEKCLAALDDAKHGLTFASGLGAITIITQLLRSGDHILCIDDLYGGTNRLFSRISSRFGISTSFYNFSSLDDLVVHVKANTKIVWLECPTNPLMKVVDIAATVDKIKSINNDILVVVDNTFQTPYFQKPLRLGADVVVYSVTKYLNGHSDVVMGAIALNDDDVYEQLKFYQNASGIVPSPFDCYLVGRSLKTLKIRMEEHMKNGLQVASFLEMHPKVEKVLHPGLPSHPDYEIAKKQWSGCSGMLSFYLKGNLDDCKKFMKKLKYFVTAESLGGFESLAEIPALMTHAAVPADVRENLGISDNLIRLSVGLEAVEDLVDDLQQAFDCLSN